MNNTKRSKILVFDDSEAHRKAAQLSLAGHDLTVVGTYDAAQEALLPRIDEEKQKQLFAEKYGDRDPYKSDGITEEARQERMEYYWATEEKATIYPDFDVVLTDLLVPASRQAQGGEGTKFVGQEMPLGTTIALLALAAGITKVAVVTDKNHHHHPASAAFDCFSGTGKNPGLKILCTNHVGAVAIDEATGELVDRKFLESAEGKVKYPFPTGETWGKRRGLIYGKDWGDVLQDLLGEVAEG